MIKISNFQFLPEPSGSGQAISNFVYRNSSKKGFTLIELLIVMTIIALLAGLSLFAIGGVRESARDGRRKSDLEVIRSALELYKADCNKYPSSLGTSLKANPAQPNCAGTAITYLEKVPQDPLGGDYRYCTSSPYASYSLYTHLEDSTDTESACGSCSGGVCRYKVTSP